MTAKKRAKSRIGSGLASRILRTVPTCETFLFFTDIGQYEGEFAPSLFDFYEKLKMIPLKSIEIHFKRGDFERWVRETLGDISYKQNKQNRQINTRRKAKDNHTKNREEPLRSTKSGCNN